MDTLVHPIVAWRVWRVLNGHRLGGMNYGYSYAYHDEYRDELHLWNKNGKKNTAGCLRNTINDPLGVLPTHTAPDAECSCGFYGWRTFDDLLLESDPTSYWPEMLYEVFMLNGLRDLCPMLVGEVYFWGRVYRHKRGYRAQYASIKKFHYYITPDNNRRITTAQSPSPAINNPSGDVETVHIAANVYPVPEIFRPWEVKCPKLETMKTNLMYNLSTFQMKMNHMFPNPNG